jgi:hypothetical protein
MQVWSRVFIASEKKYSPLPKNLKNYYNSLSEMFRRLE